MEQDKKSRYAKTPVIVFEDRSGREMELRELRQIPQVQAVYSLTPSAADRLDLLAHRYYRDPLLFWRICDASDHLDPFDVVDPGIALPIPPDK